MSATKEAPVDQQIVYLTGDNASGKTTLGRYIADAHKEWHCVDGDEFVDDDPQLKELLIKSSKQVIDLMRGTFGEEYSVEEVKSHDAEVRTSWEPFFRLLAEKLKHIKERKIVFVYHVYRQWIVEVFREYFPASTFVELQVTRSLLLDRYVDRMAKKGVNLEEKWRDGQGEIKMLRDKYGPEYKGNEEHFKKWAEWRYIFYREPWWEEAHNTYVINNDNYDGAQDLENILNLTTSKAGELKAEEPTK